MGNQATFSFQPASNDKFQAHFFIFKQHYNLITVGKYDISLSVHRLSAHPELDKQTHRLARSNVKIMNPL